MRQVIQRVKKAKVEVDGEIVSEIGHGLLVLLAISPEDTEKDLDYMVDKTLGLRIFNDDDGKMNLSLEDVQGDLMVVSQFTLYGDARKGRRPSFVGSAGGDFADQMYKAYVEKAMARGFNVKTGVFGAEMDVSLVNDGPVTIQLDSSKLY